MNAIKISSERLFFDTISPLIYGDFIEFLNDLIPGMWAERVQDKCFEGILQPNRVYPPGDNWVYPRWKTVVSGRPKFKIGAEAYFDPPAATVNFELDKDNPLVGRQSAKISVEEGDDERPFVAGILQESIPVKQGEKLNVEMYIRGRGMEDMPVQTLIGKNYGVFFRTYAQLEFEGITEQWQKFSGKVIPEVSDSGASLAIGICGKGTFWLDKVSLMPEDNKFGWRSDVVEAIRQMKPGIIRFGGSSLIYYQWEQGIGPSTQRTPFENRPWGNMEENDVGLYEFLQFCELVEADPLICLNVNSTTLGQILNEIEFCNGEASSKYGSIRAEMGHPEPFNVKYWQIGNEQSGEEYEKTMVEYAAAIRSKYPDLVLLASYPSDNILKNLSDKVDYVCPHFYAPYTKDREQEMLKLIKKIRQSAKKKELKLAITEWNHTAGHWGWGRAWLQTLYNALNAARTLNMYQCLGDMIKIANRSNMTNSCYSGAIQTTRSDIYFTPCYYVMKAYANLAGDLALRVDTKADEVLDVSATHRQSDGEVALFVVNELNEPQVRSIILDSLNLSGDSVHIWTLTGPSLDAVNSFQEKKRVYPQESQVECKGDSLEYEFPPFSVNVLRFK
jgi:alpha-N-arabinofuranosidase